jgi:hypothetical protein
MTNIEAVTNPMKHVDSASVGPLNKAAIDGA